jgi:hypothetical protein
MNEIERLQHLAGLYKTPTVEEATGDTIVKTEVGHQDNERKHIQKQMYKIGKYAIEIHKMLSELPENADFPSWWQEKITKASENISTAKHYLEEEMQAPVTTHDED